MTRKVKDDPAKKEAIADELVDVLYHVLIMSDYFGINLSDALEKKMIKNRIKYPAKTHKGIAGHQDLYYEKSIFFVSHYRENCC